MSSPGTNLQPNMWYSVDYHCGTSTCPNYNILRNLPQCWSNGGDITNAILCGKCGVFDVIDSATLLNPQPQVS